MDKVTQTQLTSGTEIAYLENKHNWLLRTLSWHYKSTLIHDQPENIVADISQVHAKDVICTMLSLPAATQEHSVPGG